MTDFSTYDRIEAYLADELSPEDLADFEKNLAVDTDLQTEVARHRRAQKVINHAYYQELKQKLQAIDAEKETVTARPSASIRTLLQRVAIAAALVGTVAIAGMLWINQSYSNTHIAQAFLASIPEDQFRGAGEQETTMTLDDRFQAAEALFEQGQYAEAEQSFSKLAGEPNVYVPFAEWNLVLCALATDQTDVFDARLQAILDNPEHDYYNRARALKQKVDTRFYRLAN